MKKDTNYCRIYESQQGADKIYDMYIVDLDDYEYYIDAINRIKNANENEVINLQINSSGGYVTIMDAFLSAIDFSSAKEINAVILGEACSAAAVLALACDNIITTYNSKMLIHTSSSFYGGKLNDIHSHLEIAKVNQNRIAERYYKYFLTEDEIADVLEGKELWLTADEIEERWQNVLDARKNELEKLNKSIEEDNIEAIKSYLEEKGFKIEKR